MATGMGVGQQSPQKAQRSHEIATGMGGGGPGQQSPQKAHKSILGQTDGNDDNWYPAFGSSMAAGKALEEDKQ